MIPIPTHREPLMWRGDWWRFWAATRPAPRLYRDSWSVELILSSRSFVLGYRGRSWVE